MAQKNTKKTPIKEDTIEKLTGYKFSPHLGNVGSKIEEFNNWLNENSYKFDNKDTFIEFINKCTEWNICDCCGLVEKSTELNWDDENLFDEEYQNFRFLQGTNIGFDAVCDDCLNKVNKRTYLSLEEITSRLIENQMYYRIGDYVILENVDFNEKNIVQNTIFGTIESLNTENRTYKLKEFSGIDFKDEDFFDNLNEAYVNKYTDFIADNYPNKSGEVDEWSYPNFEGHADIEMAFVNFGRKEEFIEHLKAKDLPYGRFLTPKFNIGDSFTVHFNYYKENEFTTHQIVKIDKSFNEADEIVYWSDDFVYISESELEKQKSQIKDEDEVLRDSILVFIFSDIAPTYSELIKSGEIESNWQLSEEYENYDYSLVLEKVNERFVEFKEHLKALENVKSKKQHSRKYSIRTIVEYGVPLEIICELQQLHNIYGNDNLSKVNKLILTQDSRTTEDYSSIEILLDYETKYNELSLYLKSNLAPDFHNEVDELIDVIIEAKADNHETLCVYDC